MSPNLSLYSPYYAETCYKFAVPNSALERQSNLRIDVEAVTNRLQRNARFGRSRIWTSEPPHTSWGMPFTASTLQIGGYHSYQHRKLQAAKVTITEPDSAVSALEQWRNWRGGKCPLWQLRCWPFLEMGPLNLASFAFYTYKFINLKPLVYHKFVLCCCSSVLQSYAQRAFFKWHLHCQDC